MVLEHKNAANIGTASSYLELSRQRFEEQSEAYWLLREASRAGDLRTTLTLLHSGTDVNPCATCTTDNTDIDMEEEELTPLHEAAAQGHIAIVRTLLTAGALPNCLACCADLGFEKPRRLYKVAPGATMLHNQALAPLHLAARFGHVEVVRLLAEANGDVNVRGSFLRDTPLHMAAWHGHMQVMRLLLEKGADVNAVDRCGGSPLHVADSLQGREILLRAGANPNLVMNAPWGQGAPLRMVLVRIHEGVSKVEKEQALEYVRLLLAHGATATSDVKSTSRCPLPSIQHLSLAVFIGVARIISMMLEVGFDPNEPDMLLRSCGAYPIHHAAREGRVEILQLLLKAGARLDVRDKTTFDSTPLHVACRYAQVGAVRELLRWGADMTVLDRPDSNGERKTPAGVISLRKAFRPNDNSVADPSQYEREELLSEDGGYKEPSIIRLSQYRQLRCAPAVQPRNFCRFTYDA